MADDRELISVVKDVCGVSDDRAMELLEAGGTVQRAIDIHLGVASTPSNQNTTGANEQHSALPLTKRKVPLSTPNRSPQKQAKLSSFYGRERTLITSSNRAKGKQGDLDSLESPNNNKDGTATVQSAGCDEAGSSHTVVRKTEIVSVDVTSGENKHGDTASSSIHRHEEEPRLEYLAMAEAFSKMAATTKRLVKIDALKKLLKGIIEAVGGVGISQDACRNRIQDGEVLYRALQLILPSNAIKLQVSGSSVSKAIQTVTGASSGRLREIYRKTGDLGDAAERFVRNQTLLVQPKPLTICSVYELLTKIASQEGKGSQTQRHELMVKMLRSCRHNEMRFLVRTLLGNMRLGANLRTVVVALAHAIVDIKNGCDKETSKEEVKQAQESAAKAIQETTDICPRLERIALALLCGGIPLMKKTCVLEVGTPVNPMLANPAHSFDEVSQVMSAGDGSVQREAFAEYKYDGVRCQAHFDGTSVHLYSRNLLENTEQYPDAVDALLQARAESVQSFIIDSEIVAVEAIDNDKNDVRILPFQDLATRSGAMPDSQCDPVRIRMYAFDLIYLNGRSIATKPLWRRQELLREHFKETASFAFASSLTLKYFDEAEVSRFLKQAIMQGAEGLMVKLSGRMNSGTSDAHQTTEGDNTLTCRYESGTRSQTWLKVKRDYVDGFAETIDVVPIGAWYGNGRKAQKGFLSPVLLAVYDQEAEVFRSISRCMSFSDAMYEGMREFYFHGTPYPKGVGIDESKVAKLSVSPEVEDADNAEGESDEERTPGESMPLELDTAADVGVNCYSERRSTIIDTNESPTIWFKPMEVFEVSFADLSLSRTHTAAAGIVDEDPSRGVALRFPRFRRRRPDKRVDQATSTSQIAEMFANQIKQGRKVASR